MCKHRDHAVTVGGSCSHGPGVLLPSCRSDERHRLQLVCDPGITQIQTTIPDRMFSKAATTNSRISFTDFLSFLSSLAIGLPCLRVIVTCQWFRRLTSHNHVLLLSRRPMLALKFKPPNPTYYPTQGPHSQGVRTTRVSSRSSGLPNIAGQRYKSRVGQPHASLSVSLHSLRSGCTEPFSHRPDASHT